MKNYPTNKELTIISRWDVLMGGPDNMLAFLEYLRSLWNFEDWGFILKGQKILRLTLHTGGRSGNESIISELEQNYLFWSCFWQKSERGGHYWFKIPIKCIPDKEEIPLKESITKNLLGNLTGHVCSQWRVPVPRIPYRCPVCNGKGTVGCGFYGIAANGTGDEQCKSCSGTKIIWG